MTPVDLETLVRMEAAAKTIYEAADKAKSNGLTTRHEAEDDRKSINLNTFVAAGITIIGATGACATAVWFIMGLMIGPMIKQNDKIEVVQGRQGEAIMAIQLDLKGVLSRSETRRSERMAKPPVDVDGAK